MNYHEIEACVIRAKAGMQEDLIKLIEQYRPFIFKTAAKYNIKGYDLYDLAQIGYIALINAMEKYKVGSHTFSSYAFNAIKNAFNYAARKHSKSNEELSLNCPVDSDENFETEYISCIQAADNVEEDITKAENIKELKVALSKLSEDELELVIMIYYSNLTLKKYAEKKGISYITAVRKKDNILKKLRCCIER